MEICKTCKREMTEDDTFIINGDEMVCLECAEEKAVMAKEEHHEIQITSCDEQESWAICQWCDSLFPESELQREVNLGSICRTCILAIRSRGEKLKLEN